MIFESQLEKLKGQVGIDYPLTPVFPEEAPGIGILDGVINPKELEGFYKWIINTDDWGYSVYAATGPNDRAPQRIWGITVYTEDTPGNQPPFSIVKNLYGDHGQLFDLAAYCINQVCNSPYDIFNIHLNGQAKCQEATVHMDAGDAMIIMLTPNWKEEYGGGLSLYKIDPEKKEAEHKPYYTVKYRPGRIIFFHGTKGHSDGYWHPMTNLNEEPMWHKAEAPSHDCPLLRITMNLKGRIHYPGNKVDEWDAMGLRVQEQTNAKI